MKQILKAMLAKAGYEIHRKQSGQRSSMRQGIKWLRDHEIHIETVLDVGASDGRWSKDCMQFFPNAKYVLFEPQPAHSDALDAFATACTQIVIPVKAAVGGVEGSTLFDASDPMGGALASQQETNTIEVNLTTIDASVARLQVQGAYLLKLDTHGFEQCILEGANETLKQCDALIIEAYNYRIADEALLFWELCNLLVNKGFRPIDLVDVLHRQHDHSLWQMDLFFIKSSWQNFNYVAYQ